MTRKVAENQMMEPSEVLRLLKEAGSFREGHFQFSSGLHSEVYIQCALLLSRPEMAEPVCAAIAEHFRPQRPDLVVAPAIGGIVVSYEVARSLGVPGIFVEREQGLLKLRRMFSVEPGQKVLVVEDVITTGGTTQEVVDLMESLGADVIGAGSIVDRSNGLAKLSVPYHALLKIEMNNYSPDQCPLCRQGLPIHKPGSKGK
jgi:orotate phosphoribosyltransferase